MTSMLGGKAEEIKGKKGGFIHGRRSREKGRFSHFLGPFVFAFLFTVGPLIIIRLCIRRTSPLHTHDPKRGEGDIGSRVVAATQYVLYVHATLRDVFLTLCSAGLVVIERE
jgi:hypothetical protein